MRKLNLTLLFIVGTLLVFGCDNMRDDNRYKPYEESSFFEDKQSSRPLVEGTVPRGFLREDDHLYQGRVDGKIAETFPFNVDEKVLKRGQERYNIYCALCHGAVGDGEGIIVKRGFNKPPSLHDERLRNAPVGYFFNVITNGFGVMSDYAAEVKPWDRWAIAAYIRVLQKSQNISVESLSSEEKALLNSEASPNTHEKKLHKKESHHESH